VADKYANFAALSAVYQEGVDYRIVIERRRSPVLIAAPHGGFIEPATSQIAAAIASIWLCV